MNRVFSGKQEMYLEIADRYEQYIRLGVLKDGERLPSVRVAAGELGVNPNTIQKAFRLLEKKGLLASLPKKGVYVTYRNLSGQSGPAPALVSAVLSLKNQGVTYDQLSAAIKEVYTCDRD